MKTEGTKNSCVCLCVSVSLCLVVSPSEPEACWPSLKDRCHVCVSVPPAGGVVCCLMLCENQR